MDDDILTALQEAAVEVRFRLEDIQRGFASDCRTGGPQHALMVARSVEKTLNKVRAAIKLRERQLKPH